MELARLPRKTRLGLAAASFVGVFVVAGIGNATGAVMATAWVAVGLMLAAPAFLIHAICFRHVTPEILQRRREVEAVAARQAEAAAAEARAKQAAFEAQYLEYERQRQAMARQQAELAAFEAEYRRRHAPAAPAAQAPVGQRR